MHHWERHSLEVTTLPLWIKSEKRSMQDLDYAISVVKLHQTKKKKKRKQPRFVIKNNGVNVYL